MQGVHIVLKDYSHRWQSGPFILRKDVWCLSEDRADMGVLNISIYFQIVICDGVMGKTKNGPAEYRFSEKLNRFNWQNFTLLRDANGVEVCKRLSPLNLSQNPQCPSTVVPYPLTRTGQ